jgi:hypothetical protein
MVGLLGVRVGVGGGGRSSFCEEKEAKRRLSVCLSESVRGAKPVFIGSALLCPDA